MSDRVRRLLVTGPEEDLQEFHVCVCFYLNAIERRKQTVFYTCMADDWNEAIAAAELLKLTVQEVIGAGDDESYKLICGSESLAWKPRGKR